MKHTNQILTFILSFYLAKSSVNIIYYRPGQFRENHRQNLTLGYYFDTTFNDKIISSEFYSTTDKFNKRLKFWFGEAAIPLGISQENTIGVKIIESNNNGCDVFFVLNLNLSRPTVLLQNKIA